MLINAINYHCYYVISFSNNIENHSTYDNIEHKFLFAAKRIKIFLFKENKADIVIFNSLLSTKYKITINNIYALKGAISV